MISNATQLIRATRGRGIVISSEAKMALGCRAPADVINLAVMWGLGQERGMEAVGREARNVVVQSEMKRRSFRGVIDVFYGGEPPEKISGNEKVEKAKQGKGKRKADTLENGADEEVARPKPVSRREQKRQTKRARPENGDGQDEKPESGSKDTPALKDNSLTKPLTIGEVG